MKKVPGSEKSVSFAAVAIGLMGALALVGAYGMDGLDVSGFTRGMFALAVMEVAAILVVVIKAWRRNASIAEALHSQLGELMIVGLIPGLVMLVAGVFEPSLLALCLSVMAGAACATLVLVLLLGTTTHVAMTLGTESE